MLFITNAYAYFPIQQTRNCDLAFVSGPRASLIVARMWSTRTPEALRCQSTNTIHIKSSHDKLHQGVERFIYRLPLHLLYLPLRRITWAPISKLMISNHRIHPFSNIGRATIPYKGLRRQRFEASDPRERLVKSNQVKRKKSLALFDLKKWEWGVQMRSVEPWFEQRSSSIKGIEITSSTMNIWLKAKQNAPSRRVKTESKISASESICCHSSSRMPVVSSSELE